ncbi:MAG: hypothetical protein MUP36_01985, partial [Demequinaceae bacterium]|nr:hypothetical protein [Demequinaceae bacterium]
PGWLPAIVGGFAVVLTLTSFARAISYHYGESRWTDVFSAFPDLLAWSPVPGFVAVAFLVALLGCAAWVVGETMPFARRLQGSHVADR